VIILRPRRSIAVVARLRGSGLVQPCRFDPKAALLERAASGGPEPALLHRIQRTFEDVQASV
jgi:hypothetical protein